MKHSARFLLMFGGLAVAVQPATYTHLKLLEPALWLIEDARGGREWGCASRRRRVAAIKKIPCQSMRCLESTRIKRSGNDSTSRATRHGLTQHPATGDHRAQYEQPDGH